MSLREKIEEFALIVRKCLNLSSPLDMIEVSKKLGIICNPLTDVDYDAKLSVYNGNFYIDYDKNQIFERRQFSIAHELGHLFLHKSRKNTQQDTFYRKTGNTSQIEWEANEFAASLLMPSTEFITFCLDNVDTDGRIDLEKISNKFRVSKQAVRVRGSVLGLWAM